MKESVFALAAGFLLDMLFGDPHYSFHPAVLIGRLISFSERHLRRIFPKTESGERAAGAVLWLFVVTAATGSFAAVTAVCRMIHPWLAVAAESVFCWQLLAAKSLKTESMKVYDELKKGDIVSARRAVSMIVGRDTDELDDLAVTRAAVETVAENTSDGVIAPMLFIAIGGAPLGAFYKAVNTMDSMLGYIEPPYKNIGFFPAKADDIANFIPARISALLMLFSGWLLGFDIKNGFRIFARDRYNHASPNSAQTESAAAGLLGIRLAGDASYHGVLHKKKYIGDALRETEPSDIPLACRIMYLTAFLMLMLCCSVKAALI